MKTYLAQLVLTLVVFLLCPLAEACAPQSACLQWTPPSTNTDGSVLTDLAGYTVYYGTDPNILSGVQAIAGASTTTDTLALSAGTWYFAIDAVNNPGVHSARSSTVSKLIPAAIPNPPSNLHTTVDQTAYAILLVPGRIALLPYGTVPVNVVCDSTQAVVISGTPYYPVPKTSVVSDGAVNTDVPLAACN